MSETEEGSERCAEVCEGRLAQNVENKYWCRSLRINVYAPAAGMPDARGMEEGIFGQRHNLGENE